jgi:hypothetical protein
VARSKKQTESRAGIVLTLVEKGEAVNSQTKVFNGVSRWRNITTLLAYLQGYAIGYSFFRKSSLFK